MTDSKKLEQSKSDKIKRQIEYYFSHANFSKDKFLNETAAEHNGKVKIEILLTFNRLKTLEATKEDVIEALKDSNTVKVVDDSLMKADMEEYKKYLEDKDLDSRTIAFTNFDPEMTLDEIEAYLGEHCTPLRILMRRRKNKTFSGTCLIEFSTVEEAKKAMETKYVLTRENDGKKIKIELGTAYKKDHVNANKESALDKEVEKIKNDFIPKLYHLITDLNCSTTETTTDGEKDTLTIQRLKKEIPAVAFVDIKKKVIRMKYVEAWEEKDFEGYSLKKLSKEEARNYVDDLNIKVKDKKNVEAKKLKKLNNLKREEEKKENKESENA
ncbi:SSB [Ecytonucleospora hepatopenaei]|uniref:SSB n=1 Tax=Ecytonucleospora hepatopenaei TaxID=646526 RepID=A0A1W0E8K5_9MICR|nr:SSB [Ecytonucleospora hepatopenaei]